MIRQSSSNSSQNLPVGHSRLVECHEVDLARGAALGGAEEDFVVAFAQELELLRFLVHEDPVEVSRLDRPDLDGLVAPAHDLAGADVGHRRRQLTPLQHDVLGDLPVGVDVDALVVVAEQQLHAVGVGQGDDGVRRDRTLRVLGQVDVVD